MVLIYILQTLVLLSCAESFKFQRFNRQSNVFPKFPSSTQDSIQQQEVQYKNWTWNDHIISYVQLGQNEDLPPLLLIHGFGASAYHWRYNMPYLSRKYRVYAIDLLGFGQSDKPLVNYTSELWRDQVLAFISEVVMLGKVAAKRVGCVVVGNSLGGLTALYAAATPSAVENHLVSGCILLNAACRFRPPRQPEDRQQAHAGKPDRRRRARRTGT